MVPISDPLMPIGFVDSIPDEVIAFFNWANPSITGHSGRTV
jgi:hypothetical protein